MMITTKALLASALAVACGIIIGMLLKPARPTPQERHTREYIRQVEIQSARYMEALHKQEKELAEELKNKYGVVLPQE